MTARARLARPEQTVATRGPRSARVRSVGALLFCALALSACERACGGAGLRGRGVGPSPEGSGAAAGGGLAGTDCSPGLARCSRGVVEISLAGFVPHPCSGAACACPWQEGERCLRGCVAENVELAAAPDAAAQLCEPSPLDALSRAPLPGDPSVGPCAWAGVRCVDGVVAACDRPSGNPRVLGVCALGCASPAPLVDDGVMDELGPPSGSIKILCRRAHAERK